MNRTAVRIFALFSVTAGVIATILLFINFFGFAILGSDVSNRAGKPQSLLEDISSAIESGEREVSLPDGYWCMLIAPSGNVVWEQDMPDDVPKTYTINDIARFSRWFLNDYPVYTRTEDDGLLVLAKPKNAVGKYEMEYSMSWFASLPRRGVCILLLNLLLAAAFACVFGARLYRRVRELTNGISDLRAEKPVRLRERGIFKDICRNINSTSAAIERKNGLLSARESARQNWIAGISHDIRTPLSVVSGYAETIAGSGGLSEENRRRAEVIVSNSMKIKKLIEDLNLISSMEYDMQPSKRQPVKLCPLLRRAAAEVLNNGADGGFSVELSLKDEQAEVTGDERLLERAVFNIINNSAEHNKNGCVMTITEYIKDGNAVTELRDNGCGVPASVIENIGRIPKTTHGLGLPMAYRIISVHGGSFKIENDNGLHIVIALPLRQ